MSGRIRSADLASGVKRADDYTVLAALLVRVRTQEAMRVRSWSPATRSAIFAFCVLLRRGLAFKVVFLPLVAVMLPHS